MNKNRPVFLDLTKIRFPITAIISILHRLSGVFVFLMIPFLLWMAHAASTASGFAQLQQCFDSFWVKLVAWVIMAALIYHLLAGIRHLLMDMHVGDELAPARKSATVVLVSAIILTVLAGVWLW